MRRLSWIMAVGPNPIVNILLGDFSEGPLVKTPSSNKGGEDLIPGWGVEITLLRCSQINKEKA